MNARVNLNTVILLLILVAIIVGGYLVVSTIRGLTRPIADAGSLLQRQFEALSDFVNPTPTIVPDPVTIIHEVVSLARLETSAYSVEKIITAETRQGPFAFLFGDKLLLVAHGQVVAGVDLSKMGENDIVVAQDGTVTVVLPAAEVFIATLDNSKSYIYDRDVGVIGMNPSLETEARRAAEQEILDAALEDGILDRAQENAEDYLRRLILGLDFKKVLFSVQPSAAATPES
jgi:hypothetical protein